MPVQPNINSRPGRGRSRRPRGPRGPLHERYFAEIAPLLPPLRPEPDFNALGAVMARYGLDMDTESAGPIAEREGLDLPG